MMPTLSMKRRPTDVMLPRRGVAAQARSRRPGYAEAIEAAAYHADSAWLLLSRDDYARIAEQYRPAHKLRLKVTPPGAWLAKAIKAVSLVLTLGIVTVQPCSTCSARMKALNAAGWRGLPALVLRTLTH